jgi:hypothetical protein
MMRVRRRGFPRDVRRGDDVRMVDPKGLQPAFEPFAIQIPWSGRVQLLKPYRVERRNARYLWLRPLAT